MKWTRRQLFGVAAGSAFATVPTRMWGAGRRAAVVVGIGEYDRHEKSAERHTTQIGCRQDAEHVDSLLRRCGYTQVRTLVDDRTTDSDRPYRANVEAALTALEADAAAGGTALFFFSGRGAVSLRETNGFGALHLACANSTCADDRNDLPLAYLAAWSRQVVKRGALPIILLDCCFTPGAKSRGLVRIHNKDPRCLNRPARALPDRIWEGEGVVLFAADPYHPAYEFCLNVNENHWRGVFSYLLCDRALGKLETDPLSSRALMVAQRDYYAANRGCYLDELRPWPDPGTMGDLYDLPLFTLIREGGSVGNDAPSSRLPDVNSAGKEPLPPEDTRLNVCVAFRGDAGSTKIIREAERLLTSSRALRVTKPGVASRDVVITSPKPGSSNWEVAVSGGEREAGRRPVRETGQTWEEVRGHLRERVIPYLEMTAAVRRLYRAALACESNGAVLRMAAFVPGPGGEPRENTGEMYRPKENHFLRVTSSMPGLLFLFDAFAEGRVVEMPWPNADYMTWPPSKRSEKKALPRQLYDNRIGEGPTDGAGKSLAERTEDQGFQRNLSLTEQYGLYFPLHHPTGPGAWRIVLVTPTPPGGPPLAPSGGKDWEHPAPFEAALRKHLLTAARQLEANPKTGYRFELKYQLLPAQDVGSGASPTRDEPGEENL